MGAGACIGSLSFVVDNAAVIGFVVDGLTCSAAAAICGTSKLIDIVDDTLGREAADFLEGILGGNSGTPAYDGGSCEALPLPLPPITGIPERDERLRERWQQLVEELEKAIPIPYTPTDDDNDDETYFFRGTTVGYSGGRAAQITETTPTSLQPSVATVFATVAETMYGGHGIVYITTVSDLQGVTTGLGNGLWYEFEVVFNLLPLDFAGLASESVSAAGARAILSSMGVTIDSRIVLDDQSSILETLAYSSLSKQEIEQFVAQARITP